MVAQRSETFDFGAEEIEAYGAGGGRNLESSSVVARNIGAVAVHIDECRPAIRTRHPFDAAVGIDGRQQCFSLQRGRVPTGPFFPREEAIGLRNHQHATA